ncbi:MAG: putative sensor protein [Candidatus Saccharibacteria bacterium]|nr:putative sensor protein [Candidatus Saccharibacteria bacterium]
MLSGNFVVAMFKLSGLGKKNAHNTALAANLKNEQQKFELIVNTIEDGVVLLDAEGVIQLFNPGAGKISGWDPDEACGLSSKSVLKLVDNKNQLYSDEANPFLTVFQTGEVTKHDDALLLTKSGSQLPVSIQISPLVTNDTVTAAVVVFRDVEQERAEEQRRADFISTASHEMRTPVAAIEGYLALALNNKVTTIDNRARNYLEKAHASTQHLGQLFQDLLTSAKAEDGRLSSRPVAVEMGSYLEQLTGDLKFAAEKKGLFMEFVVGSSRNKDASGGATGGERVVRPLYYTLVDPDRVREVVTNLFDNAVKYTDSGKVSIGLTGDDQVVQFYVRDTGPGIPAEDAPHLFQKFYRVDNSATRTIGGTGLGLFICQKIVELYHGRIWVESEVGKGSTFFINFPRLTTQQAAEHQAAEAKSTELQPINSLASS